MTNYVIIGNSAAANSAATRVHSLDPESSLTLITDEHVPYFSRCALMYSIMDHCWERDMYIADDEYYRRLDATLVFDQVIGVDAPAHELALAEGGRMSYDRLLIACGAEGRRLGVENEDAEGIYDFITVHDARSLLEETRTAKRAIVIGGGLIGAEAAEAFHSLGIPVDYLVREEHYYHIFCSRDQSRIIAGRFEHHGVGLHLGRGIAGFEKDDAGRVTAVVDSEGDRYEADIVVRAIGIEPRIGFLEGSGVECETGVVVDQHLRNAAPDVWAAGDCAELKLPGQERTTVQKLWYTALPQGWVAGENMAGGTAEYELPTPYQSAMFMDLDFTSYGEMPAPWNDFQEESIVARNGVDSIRLVHGGEVVVGASFLGTALTKEDVEHMVVSRMALSEAADTVRAVFGDKPANRAPANRVADRRRLSRRPLFWPFGDRKTWRN